MKKNKKRLFFVYLPLIVFAVFIFPKKCPADQNYLEITEIMYNPEKNETGDKVEWIEMYANQDKIFLLKSNKQIKDFYFCTKKGTDENSCTNPYAAYATNDTLNIKEGDFVIATKNPDAFKGLKDIKIIKLSSSFNLLNNDNAFIAYSDDNKSSWKEIIGYSAFFNKKLEGFSLEKIDLGKENSKNNWQESCIRNGTPGKKNSKKSDCPVAEEKPSADIKIKKDDEVYKNIYANFEVNYADATKDTKYTWNFGDGHKSYLQKTRHKYEKTGTYQASITIRGDKKDLQSFTVKVEDFSSPRIRIIKLVPNPKGKDSKEFIVIENKSKEKINLKGWSIATGWKNLVNHPIREDFIIRPDKSKKLTKKNCAFTLNNAQIKIELRYPDGKTVQKLKYNRKKDKISDDEIFELNGKKWLWNKPQTGADDTQNNPKNDTADEKITPENHPGSNSEETQKDIEIKIDELEMKENLGKFSENSNFSIKKQNRIQLVGYATKINTPELVLNSPGKVAGAYKEKMDRLEEKHWVFQIASFLWLEINSSINNLLNKI